MKDVDNRPERPAESYPHRSIIRNAENHLQYNQNCSRLRDTNESVGREQFPDSQIVCPSQNQNSQTNKEMHVNYVRNDFS